jgi:hypothetical protein
MSVGEELAATATLRHATSRTVAEIKSPVERPGFFWFIPRLSEPTGWPRLR